MPAKQLPVEVAVQVARAVGKINAILVGGQAVNFWAEVFSDDVPELASFGPFTSKDVDFFGQKQAAETLAEILGGSIKIPEPDHATPNTALVIAEIEGHKVEIDFLCNILGVRDNKIKSRTLLVTYEGETEPFPISILHPMACLQSRANSIQHPAIERTDEFAHRQIKAAMCIVHQYIRTAVSQKLTDEINYCFSELHNFLLRDRIGIWTHRDTPVDPLDILVGFAEDEGIDARYREKTLKRMIARIQEKRAARTLLLRNRAPVSQS